MNVDTVRTPRGAKWSLALLAAASLVAAVLAFTTPVYDLGRALAWLPWMAVAAGALCTVASFAGTSGWVLGWVEPAMGLVALAYGLWCLRFPAPSFTEAFRAVAVYLALYLALVALAMDRAGRGRWGAVLALAAAALVGGLAIPFAPFGAAASPAVASAPLYLAGLGLALGAAALSHQGDIEESVAAPGRALRAKLDALLDAAA